MFSRFNGEFNLMIYIMRNRKLCKRRMKKRINYTIITQLIKNENDKYFRTLNYTYLYLKI